MIEARVVADSKNEFGNRITTMVVTFPRIILAEFNTHRMFSRNSASSRAIPFEKMLKSVEENPFVPIAWQKDHKGMQGTEYLDERESKLAVDRWKTAASFALHEARILHGDRKWSINETEMPNLDVTKQLCNRLLEPFMWHTVIVTATEWENFFALRCPQYYLNLPTDATLLKGRGDSRHYRSWKDLIKSCPKSVESNLENTTILERLKENKGQAEIHMMALAEAMWDAINASTPKELKAGEWHVPFGDTFNIEALKVAQTSAENLLSPLLEIDKSDKREDYPINNNYLSTRLKIAVARCARISYTVVGKENKKDIKVGDKVQHCIGEELEEVKSIKHDYHIYREAKDIYCEINGMFWLYADILKIQKKDNYENDIKLHDHLLESKHMSPFEHCAQAMKEDDTVDNASYEGQHAKYPNGYCGNFKGFIQYRKMIPNENIT